MRRSQQSCCASFWSSNLGPWVTTQRGNLRLGGLEFGTCSFGHVTCELKEARQSLFAKQKSHEWRIFCILDHFAPAFSVRQGAPITRVARTVTPRQYGNRVHVFHRVCGVGALGHVLLSTARSLLPPCCSICSDMCQMWQKYAKIYSPSFISIKYSSVTWTPPTKIIMKFSHLPKYSKFLAPGCHPSPFQPSMSLSPFSWIQTSPRQNRRERYGAAKTNLRSLDSNWFKDPAVRVFRQIARILAVNI